MIANEDDGEFGVQVGSKRSGSYIHDDEYGDSHVKGVSSRARQENSLGELTRKFIMLIRDSVEHLCVDLNDAAV